MRIKEKLETLRDLQSELQELFLAKKEAYSKAFLKPEGEGEKEQKKAEEEYFKYIKMLQMQQKKLFFCRAKLLGHIRNIPDITLRTLLIARFINCKTWEQIAEDMGYSEKWVRTALYKKAIKELERDIKKDEDFLKSSC